MRNSRLRMSIGAVGVMLAGMFGRFGEDLPHMKRSQARIESTMSPWLKKQRTSHRSATGGGYLGQPARDRATRRLQRSIRRITRLRAQGREVDASFIPDHIKLNAAQARAGK